MTRSAYIRAALAATLALVGGCATRSVPVPDTLDPGVAERAVAETAPDRPLRVVFDWRALDGEARFSGEGVARIEPPLRARLDLFGPGGNGVLTAALVDDELRLPPGVQAVQLPPAALLWSVLGVVRPPDGARLVGTSEEGTRTALYYDVAGDRLRYSLDGGRLREVVWEEGDRRLTVTLNGVASGLPREAVYRDATGYTELMLNLERVDEVESYPPETWQPGR